MDTEQWNYNKGASSFSPQSVTISVCDLTWSWSVQDSDIVSGRGGGGGGDDSFDG